MSRSFNRRRFIQSSVATAALTGIVGPRNRLAQEQQEAAVAKNWSPPSDERRRELVTLAQVGRKAPVTGGQGVAVCSHPLGTAAAIDMLKLGGNACDAICAASIAQTVLEPHKTTLSGVFSMLYFEKATGKFSYINGSANAPASHPFLDKASGPDFNILRKTDDATLCPVPGFWGGFEAAHEKFGRLSRKTVMAPAIHYAQQGFEVHSELAKKLVGKSEEIGAASQGREMYFANKRLIRVGEKLVQQRHADSLARLAEEGSDYFYRGEFARKYSEAVKAAGGFVTVEDMEQWQPMWCDPVRSTYRDFEIVGSPSPDFGGQALIEIMNLLELFDLKKHGPAFESPETTWHIMKAVNQVYMDATTTRFAGSIRAVEEAISKELAAQRYERLFGKRQDNSHDGSADKLPSPPVPPGSNHLTVVDAEGNVATVLHSLMSFSYSTGIFVEGIYACAGLMHLASGFPGDDRRIYARICPNMFLKNGVPVLASGSPSVSLTESIVQNSINLLDFGLDFETSVHKPRCGGMSMNDYSALAIESDMGKATTDYLRDKGLRIDVVEPWDELHGSFEGILIGDDGSCSACGDPRRTAQAFAV